jgi:hypothetical protein
MLTRSGSIEQAAPMDGDRTGANRVFSFCVLGVLLWAAVFAAGMTLGWPGERHPCADPPYCYCETVREGPVGQPANTASDLGFVVAGLFIAWRAGRRLAPDSAHPFRRRAGPAVLYSQMTVFMGPGSMFFHGAMTDWGGRLDGLSMYLFILYVITWQVSRSWELGERGFFALYGVLSLAFGLERTWGSQSSLPIFGGLVTAAVLLEILVAVPVARLPLGRRRDRVLARRWLFLGLGLFCTALAIWWLTDSGRPLCDPDSWLQGHAVWHLLTAGTVTSVYLYLDSEEDGDRAAARARTRAL